MDQFAESVERESEGPWELPDGWAWTTLGCLAILIRGVSYTKDQSTDQLLPTNRALVRGNNIQNGQISRDGLTFVANEAVSETQYLRERDIVLTMSSGSPSLIGKSAWVSGSDLDLTFGAFCGCLRSLRAEDARWVYWYLQTPHYRKVITNLAKGTNINNLKRDHLISLPIPLAPLAEQRRIVARVDQLFAEIAEGEAALEAAREGLDTFRRALLKAAVTGELTKDWREKNPVTETGHDLLARIKADRAAKGQAKGRGKRSPDAPPLDTATLPELPAGWVWGTVRDIADVMGGLTKNPDREKMAGKAKYLRVANVQAGNLDLTEMKEIGVTAEDRQRASLQPGDLLVVEGNGSIDQIGRCALWNGEIDDCVHQNHIIKVRFSDPSLLPRWCFKWLLSPHGRQEIEQVAASTSGLHTLSISKIEALPNPIPPLAEAAEILRRVSEALAASADTSAMLDAEAADAARLKQSILKAAFEGRLVPQDPTDEPASAMLARLKATASTATPAKRGRRAKS